MCPNHNKSKTNSKSSGKVSQAKHAAYPPTSGPADFIAARNSVEAKFLENRSTENTKSYCRGVMDSFMSEPRRSGYVDGYAVAFKDQFIQAMKKETSLNGFVSCLRPRDAQKQCVDNALTASQSRLSVGHPQGEKEEWEMPYILHCANWQLASTSGYTWMAMSGFLTQVCNRANLRTQYVLVARPPGNTNSHAILLTVDGSSRQKSFWITDRQKAANDYSTQECIAWSRPTLLDNIAGIPLPKKEINLTGAWVRGEDWKLR
jgi:hypothetical protein